MWATLFLYVSLTVSTVFLAGFVRKKAYDNQMNSNLISGIEKRRGLQEGKVYHEALKEKVALVSIFLLLASILVLRVNIGNDYYRYTQILHELRYDGYVITEPGFNLICRLILKTPLWWNAGYLLCFAVFAIATVAFFLKGMYDLSVDFFLTFFLFMTFGMYFQCFSTMRYYFALSLVVFSIKYLLRKRYATFVVIVLLAASFHKTALLVLPFYFLAILPWKKWHLGVFALLALQLLIFKDFYLNIMLRLYPSYENETQILMGGTSKANIIRSVIVLILSMIYYKKCIVNQPKNRFFFYLNLGALALYTCGYYIPVISRIGYFLNISQIFLLPAFVSAENDQKKKRILKVLILLMGISYFVLFMKIMNGSLAIVPYQTWLMQEMEPIQIPVQ